MAFDRSKFKATNVAEAVQQDEELSASLGQNRGGFTSFIKLKEGKNLLRIYPPHPEEMGGGDKFAEPKVSVFLPMMVQDRDSNGVPLMDKGRPVMKESVKSVFNSKIHGGTKKDLVEEYVDFSVKKLEAQAKEATESEKAKIDEKIDKLRGNYGKRIQGLTYRSAWAMYVDEIIVSTGKTNFGTLEIGKAIKERLNSLALAGDDGDDVITTDPFTDPDNGRAIQVTYNKSAAKPQDFYKTELDQKTVQEKIQNKIYNVNRTFPLTDEQLTAFMEVEPLAKRFKNCFTRRDYNLQLEGLEFFDKKNNIGTFEDPDFLDIVEEIDAYYPELQEEEDQDSTALDRSEKKISQTRGRLSEKEVLETADEDPEETSEEEGDQFDLMSRIELSSWHKKNSTGIVVRPSITTDDLRELAREFLSSDPFEHAEEQAYDESEAEEEQQEEAPKPTGMSRLEMLRNRNKK